MLFLQNAPSAAKERFPSHRRSSYGRVVEGRQVGGVSHVWVPPCIQKLLSDGAGGGRKETEGQQNEREEILYQ